MRGEKPTVPTPTNNSAATSPGGRNLPAASGYAPGVIRSATDREAALVDAFYRRHPEYEVLSRDVVLQMAVTYLEEDLHAERALLAAEGVGAAPYGFDNPEGVDVDDLSTEGQRGSDYR